MIEIQPSGPVHAVIDVPSSKSYTNRALIIAALADGESRLQSPLFSDDTHYMQNALGQMGISVEREKNAFVVQGGADRLRPSQKEIFVGNAGTTMRFITTLCCLVEGTSRLTGNERMQERPIGDLLECLHQMNVSIKSVHGNQCPPLLIESKGVPGGSIRLAGNKSSQYLTSLLMCAPYFQNDTRIEILGELTSKSYVDITLDIMKSFGVHVENERYTAFGVKQGQRYTARTYKVEGDASSASYFLASAAVTGGQVELHCLNPDSVQGDMGFMNVLESMGCEIEKSSEKVRIKGNPLAGISINMNNMPDVVQTLAVTALFANGPTTITGIGNLKIKETDRIAALDTELRKLGAEVESGEDYLVIKPGPLKPALIETYDDHRMAMSFAIAGLKIPGVKIGNPECVQKSFPDFFDVFKTLYT